MYLRCGVAVLLIASASAHLIANRGQRADVGSVAALAPDVPVERALAGDDRARYALVLTRGQAASLSVAHQHADLIVRSVGTDGGPLIEIASDGPSGELRIRFVAVGSEPHTIEVVAARPKEASGRYTIRIEDVALASASDRQLWDALVHQTHATRLRSNGNFAAALSHAEQALVLREKALSPEAPDLARSLLMLAELYDARAQYARAEEMYGRARQIIERTGTQYELLTAEVLDGYARHCVTRARFNEAEPLIRAALATRERILGPSHVLVASSLGSVADFYHENAKYEQAAVAADRALAIAQNAYPATDVALGEFINRVARAQLAAGNFAGAERLYRATLETAETGAGPASLAFAQSLAGLSRVALRANDNVKAEQLHARTLALKERIYGIEHPYVGEDLLNIALLHYRRRDYATAHTLNARALAVFEKALGASHPRVALVLNNIGLVYWRQGDYRGAEVFYQRALDLSERRFGPDSVRVTTALGNLGIIAKESGNYDLAEVRYKRALAILEKHLGPMHPDLIATVESLGILYRDRGDYARAAEMFERTVDITETAMGPDHPFVVRHLDNIAQMYRAMGDSSRSLRALQRMIALEERYLPLNLAIGSERQKLAYFEPRLQNLEEVISFHVQQPLADGAARDLALTTLLQRKGRILDALADNLTAFRERARPEDRTLLDRLMKVTTDLAAMALNTSASSADRQKRTTALGAEREQLEIEIHRQSAGYLEPARAPTLDAVQHAVPADAALLEFAIYRPFDARASFESGKQDGPPRYVVYVLRHTGDPQWKDLGPVEDIDQSVERFRSALADPKRTDVNRLATLLHQQVLASVQPLWGDAKHLLVSPDGSLNLIPFETLRAVNGRFLVEDATISYLTTGRDLVRMLAPRPGSERDIVFANPDFGEPAAQLTNFTPLAATASEAQRIGALFPNAELKLGGAANEKAAKALRAPRILHIATHGFFLQDGSAAEIGDVDSRAANAATRIENPLLRSGLALAGANRRRTSGDDGILTALEAANLNLWGTKLVTLSACDTGVGVVRNGEGVYGLRRAFFLAGAESLVMSLWPVSDQITREMMAGYYTGLKEGLGRGAALRRMQLKMMKRTGRAHPFYWSSFIQAGEWAGLDGRR
jgi:CHAT domain-containing protein/Tfp pilus assembly protein PilF